MAEISEFQFDDQLLDHIKFFRNTEAKSMLNEELAKKSDSLGTLLHRAAHYDNVEVVQQLIELGSDLDFSGAEGGRTPLMTAVQNERLATVKVLLDAGANVDAVDAKGQSALQMIFHSDYFEAEVVEAFLLKVRAGASSVEDLVEKLSIAGCAPHHAVILRRTDVIQHMLESNLEVVSYQRRASHSTVERDPASVFIFAMELDVVGTHRKDTFTLYCTLSNIPVEVEERRDEFDGLVRHLCERGARHRAYDKNFVWSRTDIDDRSFRRVRNDVNNLVARAAMLEKLGAPIVTAAECYSAAWRADGETTKVEKYHELCREVLGTIAFGTLTLFGLLTDQHKMRVHVRNETFASTIEEVSSKLQLSELFPYYFKTLTASILRAKKIVELEDTAITVISKIFNSNRNECYDFARQVVGYLNKQELERLCLVWISS